MTVSTPGWITGCAGSDVVPVGGRPLWRGPRPAWIVGDTLAYRVVHDDAGMLRLAVVGDCYATDAQLRQGLGAVTRADWRALTGWPGSYWVVADDGRRTVVLTDVAGTRPVYYTFHHGGVVWASAATPLADLTAAPIDHAALVARMVCPTVSEVTGTGTVFAGVHRLPGGHALHLGAGRIQPYEPETQKATFEQAAEALREALVVAVERRAASAARLSADFSGGLDSTSLALLAARAGYEVFAVTRDDPTSANDDVLYAKRAAADEPRIRHVIVGEAEHGLFFDRMDAAPHTDQPYTDAARWSMRHAYHRRVLDHGSDLHLTGSGGDTLLVASPSYLADLARLGQPRELLRHAVARARLRHQPVHSVLAAAITLAYTSYPQALRRLAADITQPPARWERPNASRRLHWCGSSSFAAWLTPTARDQLAQRVLATAATTDLGGVPISTHRAWCELREFGAYQAELTAQLRATGINAHAPFLDNAVVRAAMSIPVSQRQSTTVQKPLLGAALRGLVPDFLLHRRTKGAYDGNAYTGIRRNANRLHAILDDSYLVQAGIVDHAAVRADLDRLIAGAPGRLAALETLITTELWLSRHTSRPPARVWRTEEPAHA
ncbi:albusnodin/ikarugamycin family macrolactam cyclase [Carbonactinospora thermoautotrophica]|uniref:albusnodin/ikarugamycin family macrolactam cyclase n=1 Tax=Carbonactinospora thermoautotrophica TaxID=1469144 RepID=UPI000833B25B|nr:albusnodin/ikarugamycin family macrolactam cyclase [Carbonactinospora thermoautotrophica]